MLGPYQLMKEVLTYANQNKINGITVISKSVLWNYIKGIDQDADYINMIEIIQELDARGWLLYNSDFEIEFDPACFDEN